MAELRELLRYAAGPDAGPLDLDGIVGRARRRRRRAGVTAAGGLCVAVMLALVIPAVTTPQQEVRSTPGEQSPPADAGTDPGGPDVGQPSPGAPDRDATRDVQPRTPTGASVPLAPAPAQGAAAEEGAEAEEGPAAQAVIPGPSADDGPARTADQIAFTRSHNVYVAALDGSHERRIAARAHSPAWSPDGKRLAMVVRDARGRGQLAVADEDGGNLSTVRGPGDPICGVDSPAWSPDGSRIAFVQRHRDAGSIEQPTQKEDDCRPNPSATSTWMDWSEIRSIGPDGSGERIMVSTYLDYNESPSWSPDGSRMVFARSSSGGAARPPWDLFVAKADGSSAVPITGAAENSANGYDPAWSPLGDWIAFTTSSAGDVPRCGAGSSRIGVISPDGRMHPLVTDGSRGCDSEPAWAPDGTSVTFTRRHDAARQSGELWTKPPQLAGAERRLFSGIEASIRPR